MDSAAAAISPSSDERFWSRLRDRVDTILHQRHPDLTAASSSPSALGPESELGKPFRQDSQLLLRGLDSVASSLSHLTDSLTAAQQGVSNLTKPSPRKISERERQRPNDEYSCPKAKRRCTSDELPEKHKGTACVLHEDCGSDKLSDSNATSSLNKLKDDEQTSLDVVRSGNLNKAKNLALAMASKASSLAKELKMIKTDLTFVQERCGMLEEENRRLREGMEKGVVTEEDDLVRLQLEALLAEKSRLANENANLTRENQCLHQLVEYYQVTSHELSSSYDQVIHGGCLDFSSPLGTIDSDSDGENGSDCGEEPHAPTSKLEFSSSSDKNC